jgi:DNA-binding GntR family transcriptional regulator
MRQRYPALDRPASTEAASPECPVSDDPTASDPTASDSTIGDSTIGDSTVANPAGKDSRRPNAPDVIQVLANRIAAALAHHKPGWTLPRQTVLARRYHVTTRQVAAAIDELAARHLIRLLPDGRACRVSPAEYMFDLAGQHGLVARVEPLHGQLSCKSHSVAWHPVSADIESLLGIVTGEHACILQKLWTVGSEPAAATTSYLAGPAAEPFLAALNGAETDSLHAILPMPPARAATPGRAAGPDERVLVPHALRIEMQQPPPWAAGVLRLSAADSAIGITVRYTELADGDAAAFTVAVLRPDQFRVIIDSVVTSIAGAHDAHHGNHADPLIAPIASRMPQPTSTVW